MPLAGADERQARDDFRATATALDILTGRTLNGSVPFVSPQSIQYVEDLIIERAGCHHGDAEGGTERCVRLKNLATSVHWKKVNNIRVALLSSALRVQGTPGSGRDLLEPSSVSVAGSP